MKYYLDTEFLEGPQTRRFMGLNIGRTKPTIDLISIGIVAEDGREYYAVSKDFNLKEAWNRHEIEIQIMSGDLRNHYPNGRKQKNFWLRENVLFPIFEEIWRAKCHLQHLHHISNDFTYDNMKRLIQLYGKSNEEIAGDINHFCLDKPQTYQTTDGRYYCGIDPYKGTPEFYAYYADYDWVAFCWLFGRMIDLPKGFPMYCRDLKQELDRKTLEIYPRKTMYHKAGVIDTFDTKLSWVKARPDYPKQDNEHNALADARWNKKLHEFLISLNR